MLTKQEYHIKRHGHTGRINAKAARRRYVRSRGRCQRWLQEGMANDYEKRAREFESDMREWIAKGMTCD